MLLREAGYDLTFVDADERIVDLLNKLGCYPVRIVDTEGFEERWVGGTKAISVQDQEKVAQAIAEADLVTTAVGKRALERVAPLIARGLRLRRRGDLPVMVVACENVLGNSAYLERFVRENAEDAPSILQAAVFPDCVVDRIVPNVPADALLPHPLAVVVERYAQWVIDATYLRSCPPVAGAEYRAGLASVLAQKLFTLNMAHAIVGYYGFLRGYAFVHEAMRDEVIRTLVDGALRESGNVLVSEYGIAAAEQRRYAEKILDRLANAALMDTVARAWRDPKRKLGPQDRLIKPACASVDHGLVPANLASGIAAALAFHTPEDKEAQEVQTFVKEHGIKRALKSFSGIPEDHLLAELVQANALFRSL